MKRILGLFVIFLGLLCSSLCVSAQTVNTGGLTYNITGDKASCEGVSKVNVKKICVRDYINYSGKKYKVTSISERAFKNNRNIRTIKLGSNVEKIGTAAFYGCKNLREVEMNRNLTIIGNSAFARCSSLENLTIPFQVKKIGSYAFSQDKRLNRVVLQTNELSYVGKNLFLKSNPSVVLATSKYREYNKILVKHGVSPEMIQKGDIISSGRTNNEWTLSQYRDQSGNQGLFYTLYNSSTGCLIVIDGGWKENASQVREVIHKYGGVVDAWFVTHFHNDHVDALNCILANPQGISIKHIYDSYVDYSLYESISKEWDMPSSLKTYQTLTSRLKNVSHLKRDEIIQLDNLKIEIFNAYDSTMKAQKKDLPNNLSLVIRISGEKDSILFCGDVHGDKMGDSLIKRYGNRLQSTYVQPGHHGNNSLNTSFYDVVNPSAAFFDAPEWLISDDRYSAKELLNYFKEHGVKTYDYRSGTNRVLFR